METKIEIEMKVDHRANEPLACRKMTVPLIDTGTLCSQGKVVPW